MARNPEIEGIVARLAHRRLAPPTCVFCRARGRGILGSASGSKSGSHSAADASGAGIAFDNGQVRWAYRAITRRKTPEAKRVAPRASSLSRPRAESRARGGGRRNRPRRRRSQRRAAVSVRRRSTRLSHLRADCPIAQRKATESTGRAGESRGRRSRFRSSCPSRGRSRLDSAVAKKPRAAVMVPFGASSRARLPPPRARSMSASAAGHRASTRRNHSWPAGHP